MRNRSIKAVLPNLVSMMIMLFLIWILPVNFYIQRYMQHQGQQNNTVEMFGQPEQLIAANTEELVIEEEEFKKGCIRAAEAEDKLYTVFLYKKNLFNSMRNWRSFFD